jgi:hypothetical protein
LHVTETLDSREVLSLEFDGGFKKDIDRDLVLPPQARAIEAFDGAKKIKLMKGKQRRLQEYKVQTQQSYESEGMRLTCTERDSL